MNKPEHCPECRKLVTGETRSFCTNCRECFEDTDSNWFVRKPLQKIHIL